MPNEKEQGHEAEGTKCDGGGLIPHGDCDILHIHLDDCPGCSACSPKKGEEAPITTGYMESACDICDKFACHDWGSKIVNGSVECGHSDNWCHGHPEAKAGEWEKKWIKLAGGHQNLCENKTKKLDPCTCQLKKELDFIRSLIAEAEQRGRLSGINEMASRGRENIKRVIGSPAVWCFEEVCKDRTCPTCKAGWKFQNDIEPAIYASLEKALKDLSQ